MQILNYYSSTHNSKFKASFETDLNESEIFFILREGYKNRKNRHEDRYDFIKNHKDFNQITPNFEGVTGYEFGNASESNVWGLASDYKF